MRTILAIAFAASAIVAGAADAVSLPRPPRPEPPLPPPVFRPALERAGEQPVKVECTREIVEDNGLLRKVSASIVFTNPNQRVFEGELELPLPDRAAVCGYALEVNGTMVPGVVVGKDEARIAFENEKRQGVDPGVVEHVKGNLWRTRIYPLMPGVPRKARIDYIVENDVSAADASVQVLERDGEDVFLGEIAQGGGESRAERLRKASRATICWDASMSRLGKVQADRNLLECLPEEGEFKLVVFRNVIEPAVEFKSRKDLLAAIDLLVYDGGTVPIEEVERIKSDSPVFLFTDEKDCDAGSARRVRIRKLDAAEVAALKSTPKEGRLLATAWAANFIADHAADAENRREEFVQLGRRYGVASPVTSLIVLERLDQYLRYKIEPPKSMSFHDEWVKRRAAEDDPIAAAKAKSEHLSQLLHYWEERVKWWKDPIPPKATPKSGVFDGVAAEAEDGEDAVASSVMRSVRREESSRPVAARSLGASRSMRLSRGGFAFGDAKSKSASPEVQSGPVASVKIAAWDPKTPYLKAIGAAAPDARYAEYLKQREEYGNAPSFYFDCAGWFFKAKEKALAVRILSNLSEMKLNDVALLRTMGWRLREAKCYDESIAVFRRVLAMRGEEPQSKRDLALVLTERGKAEKDAAMLAEAMKLLHSAAFEPSARRSARRGNDFQTSVLALEELNGLIAWCAANGVKAEPPSMDAAYRRDMPLALRIVMSWDVDETDIDLHVLEPGGEEAYYGHRRTSSGGFVSEDVTTGYGPEEYLRKTSEKGVYKVMANYYASHQQALVGAATVTASVYTGWGTKDEKMETLSFRLDKPKDKHLVGEVKVD
ncbi:MAG: DUF2135 domain-containing protein [Kiritimatiellae bacterium]|nr:DUF2135 domain-containing protein [Kiritimatiellia bacterium]